MATTAKKVSNWEAAEVELGSASPTAEGEALVSVRIALFSKWYLVEISRKTRVHSSKQSPADFGD